MKAPYAVRISGGVVCLDTDSDGVREVDEFMARVQSTARLAEAAPELLAALKALAKVCKCSNGCDPHDMSCATNAAWAAIEKAEGE